MMPLTRLSFLWHHSQSPPHVSVHFTETCFPCIALALKPRIDSHNNGMWDSPLGKPRGKASWERLEGKPQIPYSTRREARYCSYSSGGKRMCMRPLQTRTESPGETPEVPKIHVSKERKPQVPAPTPHKALGPGIDGSEIPRGPRATRMGTGLPEATRASP